MFKKLFDRFIKYVSFSNEDLIIEKMRVKSILKELGINISLCKIHNDLSVDVFSNVNLSFKELEKIPIQFNNVYGSFDCSFNQLKTLEGCPKTVNGKFSCNNNKLTNFKGCPHSVYGFDCYDVGYYEVINHYRYNYSTRYHYSGTNRNIDIDVDTVLGKYSDSKIDNIKRVGDSRISYNKITSFEGFPEKICTEHFYYHPISDTKFLLRTNTAIDTLISTISYRDVVKYIKYINDYDVISKNYVYVSRLLDVLYLLNISPNFIKSDYFDQMKRYGFKVVDDLDFNHSKKLQQPCTNDWFKSSDIRSDFPYYRNIGIQNYHEIWMP